MPALKATASARSPVRVNVLIMSLVPFERDGSASTTVLGALAPNGERREERALPGHRGGRPAALVLVARRRRRPSAICRRGRRREFWVEGGIVRSGGRVAGGDPAKIEVV